MMREYYNIFSFFLNTSSEFWVGYHGMTLVHARIGRIELLHTFQVATLERCWGKGFKLLFIMWQSLQMLLI